MYEYLENVESTNYTNQSFPGNMWVATLTSQR